MASRCLNSSFPDRHGEISDHHANSKDVWPVVSSIEHPGRPERSVTAPRENAALSASLGSPREIHDFLFRYH